ncbi:MAG: Type III restriction enzyme, res subunit:DEAD/DEAH box helicase [Candidatus Nomurabacteria bacterium GW2011_GWB1_37_5]|uniref:Type III restriction enzyme, res subunit:DEAD/DEAH box helicase n=1 Tax=Candidatus Nomurabacteria bacterium GW2011_GWB1_37_5 TaxID=1618742 RepID=A0A0G0K4G5_9BACT|nr:MAG: Type III restriction enzyme, res subunit:DEAD/DEAH box helicase [Candidatus Nomurabacteria bacterium GW2011_GWB1_37_5]
MTNQEKLDIFRTLFKGRADTYPRRWEKGDKSGWSPAYSFDWNEFNTHRARGGKMKDFENKKLLPLTDEVLLNHLLGKETIGIYPILSDNTSYFIAADFDEVNWEADSKKFASICANASLKAYTEISRSGNGAHVWIFFEEKYPCWKSRAILLELVRKTFNYSEFAKEISFDRLFPNQDMITNDGFGNLIGLPLQGERVQYNASIFCDPETFIPHANQWEFLKTIHKHSTEELDQTYNDLFGHNDMQTVSISSHSSSMDITFDGAIRIKKQDLSASITAFIKEELNLFNKEYAVKKRLGKSVYGTEKYFNLIQDFEDEIALPRGFLDKLTAYFDTKKIAYKINEQYKKHTIVKFKSDIVLRPEQKRLIEVIKGKTNGIIVSPPGSGKTVVALEFIANFGLPTMILVHRNQLLSQWVERIEQFLGISKTHIGVISATKKKIGKQITVATLQSLARYKNLNEIRDIFGVIIVDECHHIPAKTYRELIWSLKSKCCFGLTATHERKHGTEKISELMIGPVIAEIKSLDISETKTFNITIHPTKLNLPFRYKTDHYEALAKVISFDSARNELVVKAILIDVKDKRKVLVLTERKEHIEILNLYLRGETETITISGDDSARSRKLKFTQIKAGNFQVLLATGQLLGEGFDLYGIESIVLAFPFSFEGKLIQYIGRLRGKGVKHIIDFHDEKVEFLDSQFKKRNIFYKKLLK